MTSTSEHCQRHQKQGNCHRKLSLSAIWETKGKCSILIKTSGFLDATNKRKSSCNCIAFFKNCISYCCSFWCLITAMNPTTLKAAWMLWNVKDTQVLSLTPGIVLTSRENQGQRWCKSIYTTVSWTERRYMAVLMDPGWEEMALPPRL